MVAISVEDTKNPKIPAGRLQMVSRQIDLKPYITRVNDRLDELLKPLPGEKTALIEAIRYSCLAPGKRFRPLICLFAAESVGEPGPAVLDAACALEMIHCFSLIHDDLPAMDNDDLRRGMPTCHIKFGEATAILAGDTLFAIAFQTIAEAAAEPARVVRAVTTLARVLGRFGLGQGQMLDVESEGQEVSASTVEEIHLQKTAKFIGASAEIGGVLAGATTAQSDALRSYGDHLGQAFQIVDDVLDLTASTTVLGKPAGSDLARSKATYPSVFGIEESRRMAREHIDAALGALRGAGLETEALLFLAEEVIGRES